MQGLHVSVHDQRISLVQAILQELLSLTTPRRLAYSLAGACLLVSAAAVVRAAQPDPAAHRQNSQITPAASSAPDNSGTEHVNSPGNSTTSSLSSTTTNGSTSTSLNVNGQDIPLPDNGSRQQTIVNPDGSRTTVNTSNRSESNNNSSSTHIDVRSSSSTSTGGDTP